MTDRYHDMYASKKYLGESSEALCIPDEKLHTGRLQLATSLYKKSRLYKPTAMVLDLGAGFGHLKDHLDEDMHYTGIESQDWMVKASKHHAHMTTSDAVEYLDYVAPKTYDVVFILGLVTTMNVAEVTALADAVSLAQPDTVVVSYQSSLSYSGSFQAWSKQDMEEFFGKAQLWERPDNDTEMTMVF